MKCNAKSAIKLLSTVFLSSLISSCGAPGPVNHVDFNTEFADTANVKTTPQNYGLLQEKEYRDIVRIEKSFLLSKEQINEITQNANTNAPDESSSKTYNLSIPLDNDARFDGADPLLNASNQEITIGEKLKKCSMLQFSTDVKGIHVTYKVRKTFVVGVFYTFDSYKKECDEEVVRIASKLNNEGSFKFSYLHVVNPNEGATADKGVAVNTTPLGKTKLYRKLYRVDPTLLENNYQDFKTKMEAEREAEEEKAIAEQRAPLTPKGQINFNLDEKASELSDLSLKLNGIQKEKAAEWKQGIYDPVSGVITRAFTPLIMMPVEIVLQVFLRPLGAKPDDNGLFINSFLFEECHSMYINTTLRGVEISLEAPLTEDSAAKCLGEMKSFFSPSRALKFDYIQVTRSE